MANIKQQKQAPKNANNKTGKRNQFKKPYGKQRNAKKIEILEKIEARKLLREEKAAAAQAERERIQNEKEQRVREYKKKRLAKTKAISKKTQRGQPLMKDRMELLLQQIQEMKRS